MPGLCVSKKTVLDTTEEDRKELMMYALVDILAVEEGAGEAAECSLGADFFLAVV